MTLTVEEQKVPVMNQKINHSDSHLLIAKSVYPFAEFQVRGENYAPLLVAIRDNLKQWL